MEKYRARTAKDGMAFVEWWLELPVPQRRRCFQMPKEEVHVQFNQAFDIRQAYQTVMCAVIEQVQKFEATCYIADGATECELFFENRLRYQRGAWVVDDLYYSTEDGSDMFFGMMLQLARWLSLSCALELWIWRTFRRGFQTLNVSFQLFFPTKLFAGSY